MTGAAPTFDSMKRPALAQVMPAPLLVDGLTVDELLASKRALFGAVRMDNTPDGGGDAGQGGGDGGTDAGGDGGQGGDGAEKKFTQADMTATAAREKDQGKRAGALEAHKNLMKTLGLPEDTKPEDVKATLDKARKAELDAMSDTDRAKAEAQAAQAAADQAKADAERERQEARQERHDTKVQSLLERAGVGVGEEFDKDPAKRDVALARAAKLLDVEVGADSDDVRKSIEALKRDMPALFGTTTRRPADGKPTSTPLGARSQGESAQDAGRKLAEKKGWIKPAQKVS